MPETNITNLLFDQVSAQLQAGDPESGSEPKPEPVRPYSIKFQRESISNACLREAYGIDTQITRLHHFLLSRRESYLAFPHHQIHQRRYGRRRPRRQGPASSAAGADGAGDGNATFSPSLNNLSSATPAAAAAPSETGWMSESERREMDTNTTILLQTLASSIQLLGPKAKQEAKLKIGNERRGGRNRNNALFATFSRWAAGSGARRKGRRGGGGGGGSGMWDELEDDMDDEEVELVTMNTFWDTVVMYLTERLAVVSTFQAGLVRVWEERENEKAKSSWGKISDLPLVAGGGRRPGGGAAAAGGAGTGLGLGAREELQDSKGRPGTATTPTQAQTQSQTKRPTHILPGEEDEGSAGHLGGKGSGTTTTTGPGSGDQNGLEGSMSLQMLASLERENDEMVEQAQNDMEQLRKTQETIVDISSLLSHLMAQLSHQTEQIEFLAQEAEQTTADVSKGNREIHKANARPSVARKVFLATCCLCVSLTLWDLVF